MALLYGFDRCAELRWLVGRQVSAAGLEGCADSMDCNDVGGLEGEPTKGYKGRFCGRLFLKVCGGKTRILSCLNACHTDVRA